MKSPVICPTVTAYEPHAYRSQIERVADFAKRIHIDVMDGQFAPTVSIEISRLWWLPSVAADIHVMHERPQRYIDQLVKLQPSMVIIHAESDAEHALFAAELHRHDIRAGLALLQETSVQSVENILPSFDHVLIFSGNLGYHGGVADLRLVKKISEAREVNPDIEVGWDGGITTQNVTELARSGVDVLNVGSFIQKAEHPDEAYSQLKNTIVSVSQDIMSI